MALTDPQSVMACSTVRCSLAALEEVDVKDLIPLQPDLVAAQVMRIPAGGNATGIDAQGSASQFFVVAAGSLIYESRQIEPRGTYLRLRR